MSVRDFVMLAIGEIILAATFALGIMVGISLTRKDSRHDNGNSNGTGRTEAAAQWHRPRHRDTYDGDARRETRGL